MGLSLFWTPIPIGAVLILAGLAMLVANSLAAQNWLRRRREKHHGLDQWMLKMEKYLPQSVSRILARTHPGNI